MRFLQTAFMGPAFGALMAYGMELDVLRGAALGGALAIIFIGITRTSEYLNGGR